MNFKPKKGGGALWGLLLGSGGFGTVIWAVHFSLVQPDERLLKWLLLTPSYLLAAVFFYLLLGAVLMNYKVDEGGITVTWGLRSIHVPWPDLTRVVRVTGRKNLGNLIGISWPGYMVGTYHLKGLAPVKMFATRTRDEVVVLETTRGYLGLTPADASGFIAEVQRRSGKESEVLDTSDLSEEVMGNIASEDMVYMGLYALNLVLLAGLIAYQAVFFPGSGASRTVVLLPALGIGVLAFNIGNASRVYQFVPSGAYLIWALSLVIMLTFLTLSVVTISF